MGKSRTHIAQTLVVLTAAGGLSLLPSCGGQQPAQVPTAAPAAPPPPPPPPAPAPVVAPAPEVAPADAPYRNPELPLEQRVDDLIGRMTLEEKVSQMMDGAPAIDRLGVPAYHWWNEALHGVARAGIATVFPQAIGLAATWDDALMLKVASVISDEARAKYHQFQREGKRGRYQGLTFFSPNINIFRDPRWGRGHETYGEDPHLTARLGVAFIKGLQGDHPRYLKTLATAKHYAVHSGPEKDRHRFDARVSARELHDTYLPHFEAAIREGGAWSVMSAYNAVDGKPASASVPLLGDLLRSRWGFKGYVVTDCGAVRDIWRDHKVAKDAAEASAMAVKAGTDLECGREFKTLTTAVQKGLVTEADLDQALRRLFAARFRLGMFDPPDRVPFAQIPYSVNDAPAHRQLAREAARSSMVLLENRGVLPIGPRVKKLAVIGPTADNEDVLLGNYNGIPSRSVTILAGLRDAAAARGIEFSHTRGSGVVDGKDAQIQTAVETAKWADLVVLTLGLTPKQEGEEGESKFNPTGDRTDIGLPAAQVKLFEAVAATRKPIVVVLTGGSALAVPDVKKRAAAVLMSWYSGEEGGAAVADVLFGDANPSGRLPLTFYASLEGLPPFEDYGMKNRTYRYFTGEPLWPFGHGKSYTTFKYGKVVVNPAKGSTSGPVDVAVELQNTGKRAGDEVVQIYVTDDKASVPVSLRTLVAFRRVSLAPGERKTVSFTLPARAFSIVDEQGKRIVEPGTFTLAVGGGQPGKGNRYRSAAEGVTAKVELGGELYSVR